MIVEKLQIQNSLADFNNFANSHLSIQVSLDGFAYCIFDKDIVDVVLLKSYEFSEIANQPDVLLNNVAEIYEKDAILNEKYASVNITHRNKLNVLVPDAFFDENQINDYLKFNIKVFENEDIKFDSLTNEDLKNVYIPFTHLNQFFNSKHFNIKTIHSGTVLLNALFKYFKNTGKKYFFANVSKNILELLYMVNGEVHLYNSFFYVTKEDFIYYILYAMEQLDLNADEQAITFLGDIKPESELYNIAYRYIRHVNFLNINNFSLSDDFYTQNPHLSKHEYFELLHQF